ncbi:MAG: hypothetical protein K6F53_07430 [Lachnospiraceae bacterium]|nr:hypothetical protein [Lachnospiraceae bacterium]
MEKQTIFWHLPGFCINFYLYQVLLRLMKTEPGKFQENYRIGSVYGTFPGAIWNGGRAVFGITSRSDMQKIIETYNREKIPVRFTWTNSLIEEKHLDDTYCNLIMETADNGMNQVLVNTKILEDYLKERYPDFLYISSTTKRLTDRELIRKELSGDYFLVVLDYDLNHDMEFLRTIRDEADKIEILVDEICFPNCPKRKEHYREESLAQLNFDKGTPFPCPNRTKTPSFEECKKRPAFISREEIPEYAGMGFHHFKLVGRGLPQSMLIDSLLYYLVKPGCEEEIRNRIAKELDKIRGTRNA